MGLVEVDGLRFHYRWLGSDDPAAPVLVFVNGLLTDLGSWVGHVPHFADYRCLLWDCRGQGSSDKPALDAYPVAAHGRDLLGLLDTLGVTEPVSLIGLSNGGAAALHVASAQPQRVANLVISGGYARVDKALELKLRSWLAAMAAGGGGLRFDVATPWVWGPRFLAENWPVLQTYRDKGLALDVEVARRLILGALQQELSPARLAQIQARALITVGEHDLLTPPYLSREIAAAIPGARFEVLPGLGHAAALEDPALFCRRCRRVLS